MLDDVLAKVEQIDAQRNELNKELFTLIKDEIVSVLEKYPEFIAIRWTQSVPSFNDGDPCVFSFDEAHYVTNEDASLKEDFDFDYSETVDIEGCLYKLYESEGNWDYELKERVYPTSEAKEKANKLSEINKVLYTIQGLLEEQFGSNAEVIVTRDNIIVNDYSCGY